MGRAIIMDRIYKNGDIDKKDGMSGHRGDVRVINKQARGFSRIKMRRPHFCNGIHYVIQIMGRTLTYRSGWDILC